MGERYVETVVDWVCEENIVGQIQTVEDEEKN